MHKECRPVEQRVVVKGANSLVELRRDSSHYHHFKYGLCREEESVGLLVLEMEARSCSNNVYITGITP